LDFQHPKLSFVVVLLRVFPRGDPFEGWYRSASAFKTGRRLSCATIYRGGFLVRNRGDMEVNYPPPFVCSWGRGRWLLVQTTRGPVELVESNPFSRPATLRGMNVGHIQGRRGEKTIQREVSTSRFHDGYGSTDEATVVGTSSEMAVAPQSHHRFQTGHISGGRRLPFQDDSQPGRR